MTRLTANQLEKNLQSTLELVVKRGERIILKKKGKDVAALVPLADLRVLRRLKKEDILDLEMARKALKEPGPNVPLETIKERLGL